LFARVMATNTGVQFFRGHGVQVNALCRRARQITNLDDLN